MDTEQQTTAPSGSKGKTLAIVMSAVVALVVVVGAVFISNNKKAATNGSASTQKQDVSKDQLAKHNGKDGQPCWVAVDGTVYLIEDFSVWSNGEHTTSNGLAYCGADLSKVIDQAPHGRRVLDELIVVGDYKG
jgi:predicted heme/steroid binding protein